MFQSFIVGEVEHLFEEVDPEDGLHRPVGTAVVHAVHGSKALLVNQGERLVSENLRTNQVSVITFRGASGNTGNVAIGKSDVTMTTNMWILQPGESVTLDFKDKTVLLSDFYADAATNGDDMEWIVGASLVSGAGTHTHAHSATTGQTASQHHAKYLDSEAITAIEGETTLDLTGRLGIDKGADLASGATVTPGTDGNYFDITGTTTITAIAGLRAGTLVFFHFDGALQITHHATSLILQGGVNLTTAAGDVVAFFSRDGTNWEEAWRGLATFDAGDIHSGTLAHERGGVEADVSAGDGFVEIKSGTTTVIKSNTAASAAPAVTDDTNAGYSIGSTWIDTTNDKAYVCVDATATAAVWTETTATPQFTKGFVSSEQTITSAGTLTIAHSLGAMPKIVQARLICKTASLNYAVNDEVIVDFVQSYSSTEEDHGVQAAADATNLVVRFGAASACMSLLNKTTGVKANVNNVDWRLILRAYA